MSTIKSPGVTPSTKMKTLVFFLAGMLALTVMMAMPFPTGQMLSAQAQTVEEESPESQEQETNTNTTQPAGQANETNLNNGNINEQGSESSANLSTLSITSTSTSQVRPDRLSVAVGVETNGTTARDAVAQNANLTSQVITAVMALGITEDRIETSSYTVLPIYQSIQPAEQCIQIYPPPPECEGRQEIIGYRVTNTVTVTLDVPFLRSATQSVPDVNAGQLIDTAVQAGANRIESVTFLISPDRQQEIRGTLIGEAISNARQRAEIAAESLDMVITGVASASINPVEFPVFSVDLREATSGGGAANGLAVPTQILPGQQEVSTTVSVVYYMSADGATNR